MKRILVLPLSLLVVACGTTSEKPPTKWRAWCNTESRDVGPWRDTHEAAEADRAAHLRQWGWHAVRIDPGS
jgi:hypothetical protein